MCTHAHARTCMHSHTQTRAYTHTCTLVHTHTDPGTLMHTQPNMSVWPATSRFLLGVSQAGSKLRLTCTGEEFENGTLQTELNGSPRNSLAPCPPVSAADCLVPWPHVFWNEGRHGGRPSGARGSLASDLPTSLLPASVTRRPESPQRLLLPRGRGYSPGRPPGQVCRDRSIQASTPTLGQTDVLCLLGRTRRSVVVPPHTRNWNPIPRKAHALTEACFEKIRKDKGSLKHYFRSTERTKVPRRRDGTAGHCVTVIPWNQREVCPSPRLYGHPNTRDTDTHGEENPMQRRTQRRGLQRLCIRPHPMDASDRQQAPRCWGTGTDSPARPQREPSCPALAADLWLQGYTEGGKCRAMRATPIPGCQS